MKSKILLTGATGYIGYNIAKQLLQTGYSLRFFVRNPKDCILGMNAEIITGDIRCYSDVENAVSGCDYVIHAAGLFTFDELRKKEIYDVNVNGTKNICEAVKKCNIKRLVYTSSAATIGKSNAGLSDENTKFNLWNISSHYKKSKVMAENIVIDYYERYDIPAIILNPSLPLGKYDFKPTSTGMMVKSFLESKKQMYINGGFNFVHVNDVAKSHILALSKGRIGEKYIIGNENLLLRDFYRRLQKYNLDAKIIQIPYGIALFAAWLNTICCYVKGKQPSITHKGVQLSKKKMFYNNAKSRNELGVQYTPIEQAIEDSVTWFKCNRYGGHN